MSLTTLPPDPRLDLPTFRGQRQATFRFDLVNGVTGLRLGELHPLTEPVATLEHDTTRTVSRRLTFTLPARDAARVNPVSDRVLPAMLLGDGRTLPLGRYMFTDDTRQQTTAGSPAAMVLLDEMFIVHQPLEHSFTPAFTTQALNDRTPVRVDDAIRDLLSGLPLITRIDPARFTTSGSWPAGTSRAKVLADLAVQGDYFNPWFDHHGVLQVRTAADPATQVPDLNLDDPPRVFRDTIARTSDLLVAPNRFVVISNTGNEVVPRVGVYDVPASAPHSVGNRGFVVADVREIQLTSIEQATAAARTIGLQSPVVERVELSTPPDPRHDSFNVILWDGRRWLEVGWTMELSEGGPMRHVLRRVFT